MLSPVDEDVPRPASRSVGGGDLKRVPRPWSSTRRRVPKGQPAAFKTSRALTRNYANMNWPRTDPPPHVEALGVTYDPAPHHVFDDLEIFRWVVVVFPSAPLFLGCSSDSRLPHLASVSWRPSPVKNCPSVPPPFFVTWESWRQGVRSFRHIFPRQSRPSFFEVRACGFFLYVHNPPYRTTSRSDPTEPSV